MNFPIIILFISAMFITRAFLFIFALALNQVEFGYGIVAMLGIGVIYDVCTFLYALPVVITLSLLLPKSLLKRPTFKFSMLFLGIYFLTVNATAEILFWDEFGTRFNFIAVDYLVYTQEVIRNIHESYPIIPILFIIAVTSLLFSYFLYKQNFLPKQTNLKSLALSILLLVVVHFGISDTTFELKDRYQNEIAHNGIYNLFAAFKNNTLNYQSFYKTIDTTHAFKTIKAKLGADNSDPQSISRMIDNGTPKGYNVILVTVESLNANYLEKFGNTTNLTPYLNNLSKHSLIFTNYYATGTRTVRGLEALTLSIPPTPGNSIIRRPDNENLFSLGSVLAKNNYDLKFLYGGYGYFDNMNYFFANNHFKTIDRANLKNEEVTFANAWGVADEDIYKRTILEADKAFANNENFFYFIMSTSNHRPFTYPDGRVDTPSGSGRDGAIKYTDYSLQTLIETAKSKPWFDNTIFVITADHCAGSAGKSDLPIDRYHIPLIIYAPKIITPREINNLASQIDVAPTILALLGISYESKFYGTDLLTKPADRALISTYQKLGYYTPNHLVILGPKFEVQSLAVDPNHQVSPLSDEVRVDEAISYYQTAYQLFANGLMRDLK